MQSNRVFYILQDTKKILYILRGIPAIGKSTLVHQIIPRHDLLYKKKHVFSNDDYRTKLNGRPWFQYTDQELQHVPHDYQKTYQYNLKSPRDIAQDILHRLEEAMSKRRTPLIIDNTNIEDWELVTFFALAFYFRYSIIIIEKIHNFSHAKDIPRLVNIIQKRQKTIPGKTLPRPVLEGMISKMIETQKKSDTIIKRSTCDLARGVSYAKRILAQVPSFPSYAASTQTVAKGIDLMKKKIQ